MSDYKKKPDKRMSLKEAISTFMFDGCSIAFSGMGGAQVVAPVHEIIRQNIKELTLIGDSPVEPGDLLAGMGLLKKMEIGWEAYALAGQAPNFRRAIEKGIPAKIEVEDYSNFTIGLRFMAGAMNVPYMPTRSLRGSDIAKYNKNIMETFDPYTNSPIALVPAANPDVGFVHAYRADIKGNTQFIGFSANAENIARAAKYTIVTCEEIVTSEVIRRTGNLTIIPQYCVDAVVEVPFCSHPWNFPYSYAYDIVSHMDYLKAYKTREGFLEWIDEWVLGVPDHAGYLRKVGYERLQELVRIEKKFCNAPY